MAKPALHEYLAGLQLGNGNAPGGRKGRRAVEGAKSAPREACPVDGQLRYGALVFDPVLTPLGSTQHQAGCEERAPGSPSGGQHWADQQQEQEPMLSQESRCSSMEIQCRQRSLPWEASPASVVKRGRLAGHCLTAEPSPAGQSPAEPWLAGMCCARATASGASGVSSQEAAQLSVGSPVTPRPPPGERSGHLPPPAGSPMAVSPAAAAPQPGHCPLPPEARKRSRFAPACQPAAAQGGAAGAPEALAVSPPADGGGGSAGGGGGGGGGGARSHSRSHCISQSTRDFLAAMETDEGAAAWFGASPLVQQQQQQGRAQAAPPPAQPPAQQPAARRLEESRAAWEALYKQPPRWAPGTGQPGAATGGGAWGQPAAQAAPPPPPGVRSRADAERVFRSFAKQQDALDYAAACNRAATAGDGPPERIVWTWCEERRGKAGSYWRGFLAASHAAFWQRYDGLAAHARHCYEVIEAGAPCHLYYDVEFATACNQQADGDALVEALLQLTAAGLQDFWGIALEPADVVELDSSTCDKFSRHLVVRLRGAAFESNAAVGSFVNHLLTRPQANALTVRKGGGEPAAAPDYTSAVDAAVYTRNRNFRLLWSSKGGKRAVLAPTRRYARLPAESSGQREAAFLASLVCHTQPGARLLALDPMRANARGMALPPGQAGPRQPGVYVTTGPGGVPVAVRDDPQRAEQAPAFSFEQTEALAAAAQRFVEGVASERAGGQPASVRTVAHCGQGTGVVAFSMLGPGSHWCEFVGRPHRSNRVYFVLSFGAGAFCQKCYDPDCQRHRPIWHRLPPELCPRQAPADA